MAGAGLSWIRGVVATDKDGVGVFAIGEAPAATTGCAVATGAGMGEAAGTAGVVEGWRWRYANSFGKVQFGRNRRGPRSLVCHILHSCCIKFNVPVS